MKTEKKFDAMWGTMTPHKSTKELMKATKLDWTVTKRPLAYTNDEGDLQAIDDHFALVRSSDGKALDVVGKAYTPANNRDVFSVLEDVVTKGDASMETAGELDGGRIVWGLARLNKSFTLPGRDRVQGYLFVGVPHVQGRAVTVRLTTLRDACNNTMSIAMRSGKHSLGDLFHRAHRGDFDRVTVDQAKAIITDARSQFDTFGTTAKRLAGKKIKDAEAILRATFQPDEEAAGPRLRKLLDLYETAPGAQPGTAWGVLNAVTYWADHVASRTSEKRFANAVLGRTARQKQQVLTSLLAA